MRRACINEREAQLRAILNTASDAIVTIDQRGLIVSANPSTERIFGYGPNELVGQNVSILMPSPYSHEHGEYLKRYLQTGEAKIIGIGREVMGKRKDGSIFPIDLAVSEVGKLGLFTGIIRDISDRRNLQRDILPIADDEQHRIGQDLHDSVQQELAGVGMLAQTLLNHLTRDPSSIPTGLAEPMKDLALKILAGLTRTHQEIRDISKGLVSTRLDSTGFMDSLRELAARTDNLKNVHCAFKCENPIIISDSSTATHLYRIAQEAVTNALKHAVPEHIPIEMGSEDDHLILRVADDGCGFDPQKAKMQMGLRTMQYRAGIIGGKLSIEPVENGGTLLTCKVFRGGMHNEEWHTQKHK
ncbi:MAG: PAS domain S-box protein [Planctomycetes bacterium]|nr:PAS domain S-box protein [Planctomycetota bacterium]